VLVLMHAVGRGDCFFSMMTLSRSFAALLDELSRAADGS